MKGGFGTIVQIGDILVSEEVITEFFRCDYASCKGVCCLEGDSGAPLEENEPEGLERDYDKYSPLMSDRGREAVRANGFFVIDPDGDMVTPLCEGSGECAFCHRGKDGEYLCAIEKSGCRKPQSCSLYPIRVSNLRGGGKALNYHSWNICECARTLGKKENTRVYEFLKGPLCEAFGEEFWDALDKAAHSFVF